MINKLSEAEVAALKEKMAKENLQRKQRRLRELGTRNRKKKWRLRIKEGM